MPKLTIVIDSDSDAFQEDPNAEIARILSGLARQASNSSMSLDEGRTLRDTNGNPCGAYWTEHD